MKRRVFLKKLLTGAVMVPIAEVTFAGDYLEVCGNCKNFVNRSDICSAPHCDLKDIPLEFGFCNRPPIQGDGRERPDIIWDHGCWNSDGACCHYRDAKRAQYYGARFKEVRPVKK